MLKNYFKIAFRNLFRHKLFSFINIFGLALSMSICLLVLRHIKDQIGYDKFHPHPDRTYRITTELTNRQGATFQWASTPLPLATTLTTDYNIVEQYARLYPAGSPLVKGGNKRLTVQLSFTDNGFFDLFGFTLGAGNTQTAFTEPNSIVLSKATAEKFFGSANALGQVLTIDQLGEFKVTGIMDEPAGKSHIDFEAYASMSSVPLLEKSGILGNKLQQWNDGTAGYTYLLLKKQASRTQLASAVSSIARELVKHTKVVGKENYAFKVQPLNKIILGEEMGYSLGNTGSRGKVITEVVIAFIILLSACFNYTNLSIARSLSRGKEVGIRKVAGAFRYQVFIQFIAEAILTALFSLVLAYLLLRLLGDYSPLGQLDNESNDIGLYLWFLAFSVCTGLLAGALPAWALSSFKPVEVLKNLSNIKLFGSHGFRRGLIVIQFALSLVIIVFTLVFSKQFMYMATADPGFNRDHLMNVELQGMDYRLPANEIEQLQGVVKVGAASGIMGRGATGKSMVKVQPGDEPIGIDHYFADAGYMSNLGLSLLAGTTLPDYTDREKYVVLNERAVEVLKFKTPSNAVGKTIRINDTLQVEVAGVIKNVFYSGMESGPWPLLLRNNPQEFRYLTIRTASEPPANLVKNVEAVYRKYNPQGSFTWTWIKDYLYERQRAGDMVSTLGFLAFMAITIACMGLLGMVVYTTETRRREIGIRKIMGAGVAAIIALLSKGFIRLIVIAGCIALPVSYVLSYFFLNIFVNRIQVGVGILAGSFAALLALAILTIATQIFRVATANPVESLRTE